MVDRTREHARGNGLALSANAYDPGVAGWTKYVTQEKYDAAVAMIDAHSRRYWKAEALLRRVLAMTEDDCEKVADDVASFFAA